MLICMRTTLNLDDGLLDDLRGLAAASGRTLTAVVHDLLRESLLRRKSPRREPVDLPIFFGDGARPGIDIADSAELYDIMEADDGDA